MDLTALGAWRPLLTPVLSSPDFEALAERVDAAYAATTVYPPRQELFAAFSATPPEAVRVVILGQDPYHGPGQAHGLAFSVAPGVKLPPSLVNIYKELSADLGIPPRTDGCLLDWARQGVFLLNTVLTVRAHQANSHRDIGWEEFTDAAIRVLASQDRPMVFILWGRPAQAKKGMLDPSRHLIIESPHPSPLSAFRGFFGSRPFSQTNRFLEEHGIKPVDWQID